MGGCRCSYRTCTNTTKTRDNLHFFHYPVKQKERCKRWIENAQKPQFYNLDEDQLRNKVVCETHFEDSFFPNPQKKRLLQGAYPTLDGDCVYEPPPAMKIQDVQVLPANDDGTIFVLETMKPTFQSGNVESYIYTNNGLVLPIDQSEEHHKNMNPVEEVFIKEQEESIPIQTVNSSNPLVESTDHRKKHEDVVEMFVPKICEVPLKRTRVQQKEMVKTTPSTEAVSTEQQSSGQSLDRKYIRKIRQHGKDIALLKNILKTHVIHQRHSNASILNVLKKRIPPTLFDLVQLHFPRSNAALKHNDFSKTIHATSPEVYNLLVEKYKWNLPPVETLKNN